MKTNYEIRYAAHPEDAKSYDTTRLRRDFLIEKLFVANEVNMVYSMYDRMIVGGAMPAGEALPLEAIDTFLVNEYESSMLKKLAGKRIANCNILTTFGADGAEYCGQDGEIIRIPAVKVGNAVDTTGAGDTFTGYFLHAVVEGRGERFALREAAQAAAIAVTRPGAAKSIPKLNEIRLG